MRGKLASILLALILGIGVFPNAARANVPAAGTERRPARPSESGRSSPLPQKTGSNIEVHPPDACDVVRPRIAQFPATRVATCTQPDPEGAKFSTYPHRASATPLDAGPPLIMPSWCRDHQDDGWWAIRTESCQIRHLEHIVFDPKTEETVGILYYEADLFIVTDPRGSPWDEQVEILMDG